MIFFAIAYPRRYWSELWPHPQLPNTKSQPQENASRTAWLQLLASMISLDWGLRLLISRSVAENCVENHRPQTQFQPQLRWATRNLAALSLHVASVATNTHGLIGPGRFLPRRNGDEPRSHRSGVQSPGLKHGRDWGKGARWAGSVGIESRGRKELSDTGEIYSSAVLSR
jgi:hypothetical protein